jgi:PAS domain S-box-containing protein
MMYNEAYANEVAGNKHPSLMGTGFSGPFFELWEAVSPLFAECARTGVSIRRENDYLPIERYGFLEETFFSWSWVPVYGGTNRIQGFYNAPFETTQQERNRRGMQTINNLGEKVAHAKTVKSFWRAVLEGLEDNHFDVPFALLYSVGESDDADHSSMSSESTISLKTCHFEGSIGVPEGHPAAPRSLDLKRSREGFIPSFREAMRTREPTLLRTRDGTLPEALLDGLDWRGFAEPCREAVIFPVRPTNGEAVMAFLLVGINPRRPYDDGYKSFTSLLNRQLATSLASVILFEEEVRRSRDAAEAAALEQEHLSQQLALQTSRLRRMTELSPLGMFLISPDGVLREANDRLIEMTGLSRDSMEELSWMECILGNSLPVMHEGWYKMAIERLPWSGELQLRTPATKPNTFDGELIDYWVLFTAQPEFAADSSLRSIMGSITDISHLKLAQGLQDRRLQEAEEMRRQQNEFIDITSHEMRNPLSAIYQVCP